MKLIACCVALGAMLAISAPAQAQDVTLTARDGGLELAGTLMGFDGEFYRIDTVYGPLTVDAQGVICDGPGCPDLTAPRATIRLAGEADAGARLIPPLVAAFAASRGLALSEKDGTLVLADPKTDQELAEFSFTPATPARAAALLQAGGAELVVAAWESGDFTPRTLALDALVPVVAPDNPVSEISSADLARALSGEVESWAEVGGPDMPLVLHALTPDSGLEAALSARLGRQVAADVTHDDLAALAAAVVADPWALAVTGRASAGGAKPITLTDRCGFPLLPTPLAVKAEDYPLALPLYLLQPKRRLPLMAREFLEFLVFPQAQAAIASAGFVDRAPERQPMTADGLRLLNAIQGAGAETTLDDLKRLAQVMDGADRVSFTFRFEDGSTTLDPHSRDSIADLALLLEAGSFAGETLYLAGFSDGQGDAKANLKLSEDRAREVLASLKDAAPSVGADRLPQIIAFGEALPMACDETTVGRRLNRRVELWLRPDFARDPVTTDPAPEN